MIDFKNISVGELIETRWKDMGISMERTCNFFKLDEIKIEEMFQQKSMDCDLLLKWCKLLEYDFFRLYSQYLILYSPSKVNQHTLIPQKDSSPLPVFRKNIYTQEIITFIMEQLEKGEKTKQQVIVDYKIPKTTLYKWISKYKDLI